MNKTLIICLIIFAVFVLSRSFDLGHDTFNTDVWKWKTRSYGFSNALGEFNPAGTLQKYHPGVTLMWAGVLGIKIVNVYIESVTTQVPDSIALLQNLFLLHSIQKFIVVLLIAVTLSSVFYVLYKLFEIKFAIFSVTFLSIEPFYMAITREFHLEGLLSTFMLASVIWLFYFFQERNKYLGLILSSLFAALSFLTKSSGIYVFLFFVLCLFLCISFKFIKIDVKSAWRYFFIWIFVYVTAILVIWPAAWAIPAETINTLIRGAVEVGVDTEHVQYYFGKLVDNPGPFFYLVVLGLKSSVYLLIGLFILPIIFRKLEQKYKTYILYLLIYTLFYFLEISIPSKKLDRYIMPILLSLALISSAVYYFMIEKLLVFIPHALKKIQNMAYVIFIIPAVLLLINIHPDYFSYFNPLFGGLEKGIYILEPKWMIGTNQVVAFFKQKQITDDLEFSDYTESFEEVIGKNRENKVLSVGFPEKYYTQIWPFFREFGSWAVIESLGPFSAKTKYFVYPIWDDYSSQETRFKLKYIDNISLRGVVLYRVYQRI